MTPSTAANANEDPYRWVMLAGVWFLYFCFGLIVVSTAPLVVPIVDDLNLSLAAMGSLMGAWPLIYIASSIPAGAFLDRFGLRRGLLIAAVLITASVSLRALAVDYVSMFLAIAVFGIGGPLISIGAPKLISSWFAPKERGLAMGIYITGPSLGSISALALTNSVLMPLTGGSWRACLLIFAGITLLAGATWLAISCHHRSRAHYRERSPMSVGAQLAVFSGLLKLRSVQLVLLMSVGTFAFNHGLNNWLPEILRSGGMDAVRAGYWATIPTAIGILGALTIPRLAVPHRRIPILIILFLCSATAVIIIDRGSGITLVSGLLMQGIARSALMPILILVLMEAEELATRNMGAAGGLFFSAAEVGGVLGPLMVGVLTDLSGGFSASLALLSLIFLVLAVLALNLRAVLHPHADPVAKESGT